MAELSESSGLHSLASLREHETRRAQQQADVARARAEAEQRARKEAERAAAQSEHERRLAERVARAQAESTQRAEFLQLSSAHRAEFERAEGLLRSSAELKSQLERELQARQAGELRLTSQLLRQRLVTSISAAACVCSWLAAAGLYFLALRPAAESALSTTEQSLLGERRARMEAREHEAQASRRADESSARVSALEAELRAARKISVAPPPPSGTGQKWTTREPRPVAAAVKPCRDDGDPLNPCLKH